MSNFTSDARAIEQRLLELAYTTDTKLTATALAYFAPCAIADASKVLEDLAARGQLAMEVEDDGAIVYAMPGRQKLAAAALPGAQSGGAAGAQSGEAAGAQRGGAAGAQRGWAAGAQNGQRGWAAGVQSGGAAGAQSGEAAGVQRGGAAGAQPGWAAGAQNGQRGWAAGVQSGWGAGAPFGLRREIVPVRRANHGSSPAVAAVLSAVVPGAGHVYTGNIVAALMWFMVVGIGYALVVPGLLLHVWCMVSAARKAALPAPRRPSLLAA